MEKLFLNLLEMSLIGSYVILAVLFTRVFLQKSPKIFSYVLWSVVFFRLLCPVTLESSVSILPEPTKGIDFSWLTDVSEIRKENSDFVVETTKITIEKQISLLQISIVIWFSVVVFASLYCLFSYLKLKNNLKSAILFEKNIYFTDTTDSPFVFGLWNPKIYLPAQVTEEELSYIIPHEQEHIRRFDHFTRLICHVALMLHWFNPLVWLAYYSSEKDMEQSCDEAVLKEKSVKIRGEYARTLLKFSGDANFMTPLAFSESNTKGRVKNIMKKSNNKKFLLPSIAITGLVLAFALMVGFDSGNSHIVYHIVEPDNGDSETYFQTVTLSGTEAYEDLNPDQKAYEDKMWDFFDKNVEVKEEILNLHAPYHVELVIESDKDQTTCYYSGFSTDEMGEKITFSRELVFDFIPKVA